MILYLIIIHERTYHTEGLELLGFSQSHKYEGGYLVLRCFMCFVLGI